MLPWGSFPELLPYGSVARRTRSYPGQTTAAEIGAKTVLLTCAPIIAGSLFFFVALHFWRAGRELRDHGVTAQATVATKFRKGGGIENYYAIFAFTDLDGRPQKVEVRVLSRAWHMLREGGTEAIAYLPSQPEKAQLGPKWGKQLVGSVLLFLALGGLSRAIFGLVVLIGMLTGKLKL